MPAFLFAFNVAIFAKEKRNLLQIVEGNIQVYKFFTNLCESLIEIFKRNLFKPL